MDLRHGDCLCPLTGLATIESNSIDLILTDPPYGTTANKWDIVIPLDKLFEQYNRIIKDNGAIVLFSSQPFTTDLINANRKMFRYEIIWDKNIGTNFLNANKMPLKSHENILVFYKKLPTYNPQKTEGKPYKNNRRNSASHLGVAKVEWETDNKDGLRFPKTVQHFRIDKGLHTTQKPLALIKWLVKTYSNEGDIVVDSCMGSGTTGLACQNLGRRFVGFELDDKYFKVASERLEKK